MVSRLLGRTRRHDLRFCRNGRIDISSRVAVTLGLRNGDVIDILRDDHTGDCWLYRAAHAEGCSRHEAQVLNPQRQHTGRAMRAYSVKLCRAMFSMAKVSCDVLRVPTGTEAEDVEGHEALPIIIRNNF